MSKELAALARVLVDRTIRHPDFDEPEGCLRLAAELADFEAQLMEARQGDPSLADQLSGVRSHRICLLSQAGAHEAVAERSETYLAEGTLSAADTQNVVLFYLKALHELGRHDDEIARANEFVRQSDFADGAMFGLLDSTLRRHPGSIREDALLERRARDQAARLKETYRDLSIERADGQSFESWVVALGARVREASRAMSDAILADHPSQSLACYGCGATSDPMEISIHNPLPRLANTFVYRVTSRGYIGLCNLCFEARRFRDLSEEEIEVLTLGFGDAWVDDRPHLAIELLEPLLPRWRSPDLLSPLGRAYIRAGRVDEGRAMLREALSGWPNHPYRPMDAEFLGET